MWRLSLSCVPALPGFFFFFLASALLCFAPPISIYLLPHLKIKVMCNFSWLRFTKISGNWE
jgi:hypothetical protein